MIGKDWKLRIFLRPLAVKLKHLSLLTNSERHPAVIALNLLMWKRSEIHFVAERNSALTSAMLDKRVTKLTNHKEACLIWAGLVVTGQKIQRVDQWCSRGVRQGTRAHKTAGNRAYQKRCCPVFASRAVQLVMLVGCDWWFSIRIFL